MVIINDFNTSVERALSEIDPKWRDYKGLIVCGTHTPLNIAQTIDRIQEAREDGLPFLGICFGHQLAAIEYARNVLGEKGATSEEFYDGHKITYSSRVHIPFSLDTVEKTVEIQPSFLVRKLPTLKVGLHEGETYWNNYEVDPAFLGMWQKPPNFFTCQYHPEYQSTKAKPHPLLVEFLNYARNP